MKRFGMIVAVAAVLGLAVLVATLAVYQGAQGADKSADSVMAQKQSSAAEGHSAAEKPLPLAQKSETLTLYPEYPAQIFRSGDYEVSVAQGGYSESIAVYDRSACVEAWWGRSEQPDEYRRFCEFAFAGDPVEVSVKANLPVDSYRVLSESGSLESRCDGQVITVRLEEPQSFLLELNGDYSTLLSVFAQEQERDPPNKNDEKTLYIEGYYEPEGGVLTIDQPGTTVYLAPGAVLCARVNVNADGVTIRGRGAILDPWSNLLKYSAAQAPDNKLLNIRGDGATVEGIKLLDARGYNLWADFGADNLTVDSVKVLSVSATTDGLTLLGTKNALIRRSFFYCGDNALVFEEDLTGTRIEDCIIGTTCAALFPQQDIAGDIVLDGLYVFRADEGIINNRYNNKDRDRVVESVTVRNLNATDCRNLPWFFHGRFMGLERKRFVFQNISLPAMASVMDAKLEQPESIVRIDNYAQDRQTGGYRMSFENLYVDGAAVSGMPELLIKDEKKHGNLYKVSVTEPAGGAKPSSRIAVESSLGAEKEQSGVRADNLLEERFAPYASIWCASTPYLAELTLAGAGDELVYKLAVSPNGYESGGMATVLELTRGELEQAQKLSLRLDMSAQAGTEVLLRLGTSSKDGMILLERRVTCTAGWNSYTAVWESGELEELFSGMDEAQSVVLEILPQSNTGREILLRRFDLRAQT